MWDKISMKRFFTINQVKNFLLYLINCTCFILVVQTQGYSQRYTELPDFKCYSGQQQAIDIEKILKKGNVTGLSQITDKKFFELAQSELNESRDYKFEILKIIRLNELKKAAPRELARLFFKEHIISSGRLLQKYPKCISRTNRALLLKGMSWSFYKLKDYEESIEYAENANKVVEDEFNFIRAMYRNYLQIGDADSIKHYLNLRVLKSQDYVDKAGSLNNLDLTSEAEGKHTEALAFYGRSLNVLIQSSHKMDFQYCNILSNMATSFYNIGDLASAEKYLDQIFATNFYQNQANVSFQLEIMFKSAVVSFLNGDSVALDALVEKVNNLTPRTLTPEYEFWLEIRLLSSILRNDKAEFLALNGQLGSYKRALVIEDIADREAAEEAKEFLAKLKLSNEKKLFESKLEESQSSLFLMRVIIFICFMVILVLAIVARYKAKGVRKANRKLNKEKRNSVQLLEQMKMHSVSGELLLEVSEKLSSIKTQRRYDEINDLILFLRSKYKTQRNNEKLHSLSGLNELVNFRGKLKHGFPQLTMKEVEIASMIKAGLNNQEMAVFKNVEAHSIRVSKSRIKKKMNLGKHVDLKEFLEEIGRAPLD